MSNPHNKLTKDLHVRVSDELDQRIGEIAKLNHLKTSTFVRLILIREVDHYIRNRIW